MSAQQRILAGLWAIFPENGGTPMAAATRGSDPRRPWVRWKPSCSRSKCQMQPRYTAIYRYVYRGSKYAERGVFLCEAHAIVFSKLNHIEFYPTDEPGEIMAERSDIPVLEQRLLRAVRALQQVQRSVAPSSATGKAVDKALRALLPEQAKMQAAREMIPPPEPAYPPTGVEESV